MNRRTYLAGVGSCGFVGLAGCLDIVTGDQPLTFEAEPIIVGDTILAETGYELDEQNAVVIERAFSVAGESRQVVVTNHQSEYEKVIDLGPLGRQRGAVFTALSTPQVSVMGREFNPVADMSTVEIAEMVQDQYDEIRSVHHIEDRDITIYGESTLQSEFRACSRFAGTTMDIYLHVGEAVPIGDDLVITIGGYPQITADEEADIIRMMEGVEPAD